jgi:hypothetical protein
MPDKRAHRGPHPDDARLFAPDQLEHLRAATADLSWLLSRGYAVPSALKLVGDRYNLAQRQRVAVARSACSDEQLSNRSARRAAPAALRGWPLMIDGYNVLTTIEAALGQGVILAARDGCYRDLASMHGTYRKVAETVPALELAGRYLAGQGAGDCLWLLDRPVSNSGRLKAIMLAVAAHAGWSWRVELATNPDRLLAAATCLVATADSAVLDQGPRWLNLAREILDAYVPSARILHLGA